MSRSNRTAPAAGSIRSAASRTVAPPAEKTAATVQAELGGYIIVLQQRRATAQKTIRQSADYLAGQYAQLATAAAAPSPSMVITDADFSSVVKRLADAQAQYKALTDQLEDLERLSADLLEVAGQ